MRLSKVLVMSMKLKFIKNTMLDATKFDIVVHEEVLQKLGLSSESFDQFKKQWNVIRKSIHEADSIEEIKNNMITLGQLHQDSLWSKISLGTHDESLVATKMKMRNIYFYPKKAHIDETIQKIIKQFEIVKEIKVLNDIILNDIVIEREFKRHIFNVPEHNELMAKKLVNMYAFSFVELGTDKDTEFLKVLDNSAKSVCKKMKMHPHMIGLNQHISISQIESSASEYCLGSYVFDDKHIKLKLSSDMSSTLLHEWVHAIDNIVLSKIKDVKIEEYIKTPYECDMLSTEKNFSSDYNNLIEKPISPSTSNVKENLFAAHHQLRAILTDIRNIDPQVTKHYIEERNYLATTKFWSIVMGDDWYTLNDHKRQSFVELDMQTAINNFCSEQNQDNKNYLNLQIKKRLLITDVQAQELIDTYSERILNSVKPYIQESQSSPILKKSLLLEICENHTETLQARIGRVYIRLKNYFKTQQTIDDKTNDQDYLVQPPELLARYFQANTYSFQSQMVNILNLTMLYPLKDKGFIEKKDSLLDNVSTIIGLEKNSVLKEIARMRKTSLPKIAPN